MREAGHKHCLQKHNLAVCGCTTDPFRTTTFGQLHLTNNLTWWSTAGCYRKHAWEFTFGFLLSVCRNQLQEDWSFTQCGQFSSLWIDNIGVVMLLPFAEKKTPITIDVWLYPTNHLVFDPWSVLNVGLEWCNPTQNPCCCLLFVCKHNHCINNHSCVQYPHQQDHHQSHLEGLSTSFVGCQVCFNSCGVSCLFHIH